MSRKGKPPLDNWECQYCKQSGTMDQLRVTSCSYEYPPCKYCGQTPECARDCTGMAKILNDPTVYVVGRD